MCYLVLDKAYRSAACATSGVPIRPRDGLETDTFVPACPRLSRYRGRRAVGSPPSDFTSSVGARFPAGDSSGFGRPVASTAVASSALPSVRPVIRRWWTDRGTSRCPSACWRRQLGSVESGNAFGSGEDQRLSPVYGSTNEGLEEALAVLDHDRTPEPQDGRLHTGTGLFGVGRRPGIERVPVESSISVTAETVLGDGSPPCGRRTNVIDLPSLSIDDGREFHVRSSIVN